MSTAYDQPVLDAWWSTLVRTGSVPESLQHVQGRLIRAVHRGLLPSGSVHVKTMTFPRGKDRLRYAFRALPAVHEARMLRLTQAAGIPCPEIVDVRVQRRFGLPSRSMLVLRSLRLSPDPEDTEQRILDEVQLAVRLLAAGIHHRDLHTENFVRAATGQLCVLDMQSASAIGPDQGGSRRVRLGVAARLLRDRVEAERQVALAGMFDLGLLQMPEERVLVIAEANAQFRNYQKSRIRRCFTNSTEFERRITPVGVEYRRRGPLPDGRWWWGRRSLRQAWLGQRIRYLKSGVAPPFEAFFQKWWWLGGGAALYVPGACEDERIEVEVGSASSALEDSVV